MLSTAFDHRARKEAAMKVLYRSRYPSMRRAVHQAKPRVCRRHSARRFQRSSHPFEDRHVIYDPVQASVRENGIKLPTKIHGSRVFEEERKVMAVVCRKAPPGQSDHVPRTVDSNGTTSWDLLSNQGSDFAIATPNIQNSISLLQIELGQQLDGPLFLIS